MKIPNLPWKVEAEASGARIVDCKGEVPVELTWWPGEQSAKGYQEFAEIVVQAVNKGETT